MLGAIIKHHVNNLYHPDAYSQKSAGMYHGYYVSLNPMLKNFTTKRWNEELHFSNGMYHIHLSYPEYKVHVICCNCLTVGDMLLLHLVANQDTLKLINSTPFYILHECNFHPLKQDTSIISTFIHPKSVWIVVFPIYFVPYPYTPTPPDLSPLFLSYLH